MEHMAWLFLLTRLSNDCSEPAPRSSTTKQWTTTTASNYDEGIVDGSTSNKKENKDQSEIEQR